MTTYRDRLGSGSAHGGSGGEGHMGGPTQKPIHYANIALHNALKATGTTENGVTTAQTPDAVITYDRREGRQSLSAEIQVGSATHRVGDMYTANVDYPNGGDGDVKIIQEDETEQAIVGKAGESVAAHIGNIAARRVNPGPKV
jgi:hypothetical protein